MKTNENTISVLNDLIEINNDRIAGYEKAEETSKTDGPDLHGVFNKMAGESRNYVAELQREVTKLGGESATGTTNKGKIYRAWMDVKTTFSGDDRQSTLDTCEFGEDAAQKAYRNALQENDVNTQIRNIIAEQQAKLKNSHDLIKRYRDEHLHVEA